MANDGGAQKAEQKEGGLGQLLSQAAALLILAGVGAGVAALVSPSLPEQRIPYGDESLGHIATQTVRAGREYDVPDPLATARRQQEALAEVRPVYDYDPQILAEVESRVAESFAFARGELAVHPRPVRAPPLPARATRRARALAEKEFSETAGDGALRDELMGRLQTFIEPRDFAALADEGFSERVEEALAGLVRSQLSQFVLEDRALLPAERDRGIYVRALPEGGGEVVSDLQALRDLPTARAEAERSAAGLAAELDPGLRRALGHLARGALRPNLTYAAAETARRRERAGAEVAPVVLHLGRGDRIVEAGERISARQLLIFRTIRGLARPVDAARARLGGGLLAALLAFLCYKLVRPTVGRRPTRRDALFLAAVLLLTSGLIQGLLLATDLLQQSGAVWPLALPAWGSRLGSVDWAQAVPYAMPVALGTLLVRLLLGPQYTALYAVGSSMLLGLLGGGSLSFAVFALAGSLLAARRARHITHPGQLFQVGLFIASTNVAVLVGVELLFGHLLERDLLAELAAGVVGGALVTPLLAAALAPPLEAVFGYVSDAKLAGLCNLNQPALKELIVRAPGTYHHSILLAELAAAAATAIGANPWLARAVGLYHDLGKGKTPLAFSENQKLGRSEGASGEDLAETLQRHIGAGLELGRRYKLPRLVLEAIAQHHGTRRVGLALDRDYQRSGPALPEPRYPGPLPRRRETALVMLADAVEAQSRRLSPRDADRLRPMVASAVAEIAAEGQLDDSGLTLGDLPRVVESFVAGLQVTLLARGSDPADGPPLQIPLGLSRSALQVN